MSNYMSNPFEHIYKELFKLNEKFDLVLNQAENERKNKLFTVEEASEFFRVDVQTTRAYIKKGLIKGQKVGRKILIPYSEIFDSMDEVKSLKYKRVS
ncbi:helix-turn-helix domain-containing protein [Wenyingzhuangia sp. IMCC45574]